MTKRFFVFLLSFFFFIGGTLATAQAASVEADDGISLTSLDDSTNVTGSYSLIRFYDDSFNTISTLSSISVGTQITIPAGTRYIRFVCSSVMSNGYSGNYAVTYMGGFGGYEVDTSVLSFNNGFRLSGTDINSWFTRWSENEIFISSEKSGVYYAYTYSFDLYGKGTNLFWCIELTETVSSSVSGYAPYITLGSSSSSGDLEETNNLISTSNGLLSNIWSSITELPQQIINLFITAMQSLFIPSDDYFTTKFNELYVLFDEKLGFLMYPSEVFSSFVDALQASSDGFTIDFPAFSLDVGGASYQVWEEYVFNFDDIKENFPEIFSAAEIIFTVILCGYSINLIITYYDVVVWGSSSTALVDQGGRDDY